MTHLFRWNSKGNSHRKCCGKTVGGEKGSYLEIKCQISFFSNDWPNSPEIENVLKSGFLAESVKFKTDFQLCGTYHSAQTFPYKSIENFSN